MTTNQSDNRLIMGKIVDAFGIKGWIKILPYTEELDALVIHKEWLIGDKSFKVLEVNVHGNVLVARLDGITDRNQAELLKNSKISIDRAELPETATDEDEYYWHDLVGLTVMNQSDVVLGQVSRLFSTGDVDVFAIKSLDTLSDPNAKEIMIPYVEAYVFSVSLEEKIIRVDWELDW